MRINDRIRRMEQRLERHGGCRVCGGNGPAGIQFIMAGLPLASAQPRMCDGCGRDGAHVFHIETIDLAAHQRPVVLCGCNE